jgi:hypothetical protein
LFDHLLTVPDLVTKVNRIKGDEKPRIWFHDDSFLYYDESGRLWSGLEGTTRAERKQCDAQIAIDNFGLDKQVFTSTPINFEGRTL